jgi:hypothetical protein
MERLVFAFEASSSESADHLRLPLAPPLLPAFPDLLPLRPPPPLLAPPPVPTSGRVGCKSRINKLAFSALMAAVHVATRTVASKTTQNEANERFTRAHTIPRASAHTSQNRRLDRIRVSPSACARDGVAVSPMVNLKV